MQFLWASLLLLLATTSRSDGANHLAARHQGSGHASGDDSSGSGEMPGQLQLGSGSGGSSGLGEEPESGDGSGEVTDMPLKICEFTCGDGACIKKDQKCDGTVDCTDGLDEAQCETEKAGRCPTIVDGIVGICIEGCSPNDDSSCPEGELCCPNGCGHICTPPIVEEVGQCQPGMFACPVEGTCIPEAQRCDGTTHCSLGEDEVDCPGALAAAPIIESIEAAPTSVSITLQQAQSYSYVVSLSGDGGSSFDDYRMHAQERVLLVEDLMPGSSYSFTVRVVVNGKFGASSKESFFSTPAPAVVSGFSLGTISSSFASVEIQAPADLTWVTGYKVLYNSTASNVKTVSVPASAASVSLVGLMPNTMYWVRVQSMYYSVGGAVSVHQSLQTDTTAVDQVREELKFEYTASNTVKLSAIGFDSGYDKFVFKTTRLDTFEYSLYESSTSTVEIQLIPDVDYEFEVIAYKGQEAKTITVKEKETCQATQFQCLDELCVDDIYLCDGNNDCSKGEDEENCPDREPICEANELRCADKSCYLAFWRCDGTEDCSDGSDEADCSPTYWFDNQAEQCTESPNQMQCGDKQLCYPRGFWCDKQNDCRDGSDELGCGMPKVVTHPTPMVNASAGERVQFWCEVSGIPNPWVVWRYNWGHLPDEARFSVTHVLVDGIVRSTLTISEAFCNDTGAYSCEALNNIGRVFATDTILNVGNCKKPGTICNVDEYEVINENGEKNCSKCYCSGVSSECSLIKDTVTHELERVTKGFRVTASSQELLKPNKRTFIYGTDVDGTKDGVLRYGGVLNYTIQPIKHPDIPLEPFPHKRADVVLSSDAKSVRFGYFKKEPYEMIDKIQEVVRLLESNFVPVTADHLPCLDCGWTKADFLELLNGEFVLEIKGAIFTNQIGIKFLYVDIPYAKLWHSTDSEVKRVNQYIPVCKCPPGYSGHMCQNCAEGFSPSFVGPNRNKICSATTTSLQKIRR